MSSEQNDILTVLGDLSRLRMRDVFVAAAVASLNFIPEEQFQEQVAKRLYAFGTALAKEKRRLEDEETKHAG